MDEITKAFLVESYESLDRLDRDLVSLEKAPHEKETLGSIFRTIHTLKGTSEFLGFGKLEAVAQMADPGIANDVVGELCNRVAGNFKSNLCDAGIECKLRTPRVTRTKDSKLQSVPGGSSERYAFRAKELDLFADLSVNPWVHGWK